MSTSKHPPAGQANRLVLLPCFTGLCKILALVRAAAFLARERRAHDAFCDEAHVAQVVQIHPLGIERTSRCRLGANRLERHDVLKRFFEAG